MEPAHQGPTTPTWTPATSKNGICLSIYTTTLSHSRYFKHWSIHPGLNNIDHNFTWHFQMHFVDINCFYDNNDDTNTTTTNNNNNDNDGDDNTNNHNNDNDNNNNNNNNNNTNKT